MCVKLRFCWREANAHKHIAHADRVGDTDKRKFAPDVCATHAHTPATTVPFRFSVRFGSHCFHSSPMHSTFTCSAFARGVFFGRSRPMRRREIFALRLGVHCRFAFIVIPLAIDRTQFCLTKKMLQ